MCTRIKKALEAVKADGLFFYFFLYVICILHVLTSYAGRSVFRPDDPHMPMIEVCWNGSKKVHKLRDYHLEEYPLFHTYDQSYFDTHLLPDGAIPYRQDPTQSIDGTVLSELIEQLVAQLIADRKQPAKALKELPHFTILKKRDFVWKTATGCLIVKFNDYPFIVKLFLETPKSFVRPFDKGFEPTCFFLMGGGANRHISGLTRIPNLELVQKQIQEHPTWKDVIEFPRKWFWAPKKRTFFTLTGYNIGQSNAPLVTEYPGIYAVVVDAIDIERTFSLTSSEDRKLALSTSKYLKSFIDAHINNFVIERETGKIVIIDTEHFPTVVGLRKELPGQGYVGWYGRLAAKRVRDTYCQTKYTRRSLQKRGPSPLALLQY
ncbi:MAG: hypothetical protein AB7F19_07150 [Candidatus Babeliales bacterium]